MSAVANGLAKSIHVAMNDRILDYSYKIDFGKLHDFVAGSDDSAIKRCMLFGSRPPNDSLWYEAKRKGFEVCVQNRNVQNKEKKVDTGIVTQMVRDAYKLAESESDTMTLVAGDGDYVPTVRTLKDDGFKVEVVFWDHASHELKAVAGRGFISLNRHLDHLARR